MVPEMCDRRVNHHDRILRPDMQSKTFEHEDEHEHEHESPGPRTIAELT